MPTGKVKFYNNDKGYGFVAPDGGGEDVFVHASALKNAGLIALEKDSTVSYDLVDSPRGVKGVNIKVLHGAA